MKTVGIICEYNPFHNGHRRQLQLIREHFGEECTIVCLMSGNFVQRGAPAIVDKSIRAHTAVLSGADLVLELPVGIALSSAEGFAVGGVGILSDLCDVLCFGTESMDGSALVQTAEALLHPAFSEQLKEEITTGCSFPAARQAVLRKLGIQTGLENPNDILGVEYTKAILAQHSPMVIYPIPREGSYHSEQLDYRAPSATALRLRMLSGKGWEDAVPPQTLSVLKGAPLHTLQAGERAILTRLRTMSDQEFEALPFGSEGLWRKLMKSSRSAADLASIVEATKSKRYTRTRIDRMILCAFLGLTAGDLGAIPPKIRVLAFTDRGRSILRAQPCFCNAGEEVDEAEQRLGSLYGLFRIQGIDPPDLERKRRVIYEH